MRKLLKQLSIEATLVLFLFTLLFCSWLLRDLAEINKGEFSSFHLPIWVDALIHLALILANFMFVRKAVIIQKHQKTNDLFAINLYLGGSIFVIVAFFHGLSILSHRHYYNIFFKVFEKILIEQGAILYVFSSYFIFRNTSLLKKDIRKIKTWRVFDLWAIGSFLFIISAWFDLYTAIQVFMFLGMFIVAVYISVQQEWVGYQSRVEKLNSIAQLIGIVAIGAILLTLWENKEVGHAYTHLPKFKYLAAPASLSLLFCIFAIGTLAFSFPASNHYELYNNEFDILVRLSGNSTKKGAAKIVRNNEDILSLLLKETAEVYYAHEAWIEPHDKTQPIQLVYQINSQQATENTTFLRKYIKNYDDEKISILDIHQIIDEKIHTHIRSLYTEEIKGEQENFGRLILVWHLDYGFDEQVENKIDKIVKQAITALENNQNIKNSIELQRYYEHLSIAKAVQQDLLPRKLNSNQYFEIDAISVEAEEVGGDYYELTEQDDQYKLIIADVSGKGTKAAFYMAQLKGAVKALNSMDLPLSFFISSLNRALSHCLSKGNFITLTALEVEPSQTIIRIVRAGHCPTLYYHTRTQVFDRITPKGIGIGLISNGFEDITELLDFNYLAGDLLILFTDGITEARNPEGEEFGIERLERIVRENADQNLTVLNELIIKSVHIFTKLQKIDDDFTVITLRFL